MAVTPVADVLVIGAGPWVPRSPFTWPGSQSRCACSTATRSGPVRAPHRGASGWSGRSQSSPTADAMALPRTPSAAASSYGSGFPRAAGFVFLARQAAPGGRPGSRAWLARVTGAGRGDAGGAGRAFRATAPQADQRPGRPGGGGAGGQCRAGGVLGAARAATGNPGRARAPAAAPAVHRRAVRGAVEHPVAARGPGRARRSRAGCGRRRAAGGVP